MSNKINNRNCLLVAIVALSGCTSNSEQNISKDDTETVNTTHSNTENVNTTQSKTSAKH
ncbi:MULTISPECIES: hypothetical protein [Methanobacterium]|uniref:Uncharacterized protein n=1 Tax=Methanobacterium veterum TaxID=408577 RepID=A0A9E4ZY23_9EURY|nr:MULTISPECIES: hypothetical protein [Methanobacterium]MCZ3367366.1 hypothetical protein [Methanobacterium veterum]MCZ3373486.1 hypothetical protein [Methanobacterium veterum]